ncbi:MAG: hypothetical protein KDD68_12205 [Bdellovibrionales bacterium]|nr:hypothetical protein [Bdellovibrionales bacterium]
MFKHWGMRKILFALIAFVLLSCLSSATLAEEWIERINVRDCFGAENNPFGFESCMNRNLRVVGETIGLILQDCYGVEYNPFGYENCMNDRWRRVAATVRNSGLRYCYNLDAAPFNYEHCSRQNWRRLSRIAIVE